MGLLDLFLGSKYKKSEIEEITPAETKNQNLDPLHVYSNIRVEVLDDENNLLFIAKIVMLGGGNARLRQISKGILERESKEPFHVHLRGYDEKQQVVVNMEGMIVESEYEIKTWETADLKIISEGGNDREFFRQSIINVTGEIIQDGVDPVECRLINLSLGGLCLRTLAEYQVGDVFKFKCDLMSNRNIPFMTCSVRRVSPREEDIEYGCYFVNLAPETIDKISRIINEIQIKRMKTS